MNLRNAGAAFAAVLAMVVLAGCASEVKRQPTEMTIGIPEAGKRFVLRQDVSFRLDSGYQRTVPAQTEFAVAGRLAQGLVLKPTQTVLTIEGAHMHEAFAVLRDDTLVGFYLPVEKAFSTLSQSVPFPLVERK